MRDLTVQGLFESAIHSEEGYKVYGHQWSIPFSMLDPRDMVWVGRCGNDRTGNGYGIIANIASHDGGGRVRGKLHLIDGNGVSGEGTGNGNGQHIHWDKWRILRRLRSVTFNERKFRIP
jgi:hypothetical protein